MLVRLTSKNQITLPESVAREFPRTGYFEVEAQDGRIVLTPVRTGPAAARGKLASLGVGEADIGPAVKWARRRAK